MATGSPWRSGLLHPAWWLALFLLVLNDHWLKGSALPGWFTGKLSDFAGLVVAPVLLVAVVAPRRSWLRATSFALAPVVFVAVNVSVRAADAMAALMSTLGFPWRIWTDWTDLSALLVLPFAWHLTEPRPVSGAGVDASRAPREGNALVALGVILGGLACLGTSPTFERIQTSAYLMNGTQEQLTVDILRPAEAVDCDAVSEAPERVLTSALFTVTSCRTMRSHAVASLDREWRDLVDPSADQAPYPTRACDAAVVRIPGAANTLFFWETSPQVIVELVAGRAHMEAVLEDPHSVLVEALGDERLFAPGDRVRAWQVDWALPRTSDECTGGP